MKSINKETVTLSIRQIIKTLLDQTEGDAQFGDQESLVLSRRLSSLQLLELAVQLEQTYGLNFSTLGFNQYDFDTVESIVDFVLGTSP